MLDDLVETIETLQKRIREHAAHIGAYESRTRVTLIGPMLSALGWDVSDPDLVEIEPSIGSGWADYALLDASKKPVMLIEAKKLADKDADGALSQSSGYLMTHNRNNSHKIVYCAWTNGDKWEVVDVTKQESVINGTLTERGTAPVKFALRFLGLWRRSLQDGSFEAAVEPLTSVSSPLGKDEPQVGGSKDEPAPLAKDSSGFLTPYAKSEIVRLHGERMAVRAIASRLGVSGGSVRRTIRRSGQLKVTI